MIVYPDLVKLCGLAAEMMSCNSDEIRMQSWPEDAQGRGVPRQIFKFTHSATCSDTHSDTQSDTQSETHSDTQSETHSDTQSETHSDTQSETCNNRERKTYSLTFIMPPGGTCGRPCRRAM